MTVLVPAGVPQLRAMMRFMVNTPGPMYLRVSRNDIPEITGENPDPIAPAVMKEGGDAAVLACGTMVHAALCAAEKLAKQHVSARVINVPCLKPLDEAAIRALLTGVRAVVTAEEHSVIGGLSSAVSWALRNDHLPMEAVAIGDVFGQSAHDSESLLRHYHLTDDDIVDKVLRALEHTGQPH